MKIRIKHPPARAVAFLLPAAMALSAVWGCAEDQTGRLDLQKPAGSIVSTSACKDLSSGPSFDHESAGLECFEYEYDGEGALGIVHVNSSLNCCPGTITADIDFENGVITIIECEGEDAEPCDCMCLYDIEYAFDDIQAGSYTVIFISSGSKGLEPLEAEITLDGPSSGKHCVERASYPWF